MLNPLKDHPAWVVTYPDAAPAPKSGRRAGPPIDPACIICESTIVVDAATAALISNIQDCHPR